MSHTSSQTFLRELDKKLWTAADKLRSNLDAAVYKHAVLGLIFLKYVSDSSAQRQAEIAVGVPPSGSASQTGLAGRQIAAMLKDPENDFFVDPAGYDNPARYDKAIHRELEERDYYIEKNVLGERTRLACSDGRPAGWSSKSKLPAGTEILGEHTRLACSDGRPADRSSSSKPYKITSTGKLIDDALEAVEKKNVRNGDLRIASSSSRRWAIRRSSLPNLAGLIDLIATIPFQHADLHAKDILGHNPKSSPANSSSAPLGDLCASAFNPPLPIMAIGMSPLPDTFTRDQHPDLRADFAMALPSAAARSSTRSLPADRPTGRINPPFNIKEWWDGKLEGDARWSRSEVESASHAQFYKNRGKYGTPPQGNANFAWVQHMLHHLAPNGSMALLLANGSMSSNSSGEGDIRRALIEARSGEAIFAISNCVHSSLAA